MIFRRLADALKRQDWFVVVVEILIVVIGIVIGLQVDDWNEARKDKKAEQEFIRSFHEDLLQAEGAASRVKSRRLALIDDLTSATDVILGNTPRDGLTEAECRAIGDSRYINIVVSEMPSLVELMETEGLKIVTNLDLRQGLISLRQKAASLRELLLPGADPSNLPELFPGLIKAAAYYDQDLKEFQQNYECDLALMKSDQGFINYLSDSVDTYDGYLRDGLIPWTNQMAEVHRLVDVELGISHEGEGN